METIITEIRGELAKYKDRKYCINAQQFSKEKLKQPWVLKTPIMRQVAAESFSKIKHLPKQQIFALCEKLLLSGNSVEKHIAFEWAFRSRKHFEKTDFRRFETWLKLHVNGWGSCDDLCGRALGHLIYEFPELSAKTEPWAKSRNRWLRRASAVTLIYSLRKRLLLVAAFRVADMLLKDEEDLVQKGYGWMLKEASNQFPDEAFRYVMEHKREMPRTALRYAVEKLPPDVRKEAMKKD
jgi:3-methyladenine DNA glycosylase AlkD